MTFTRAEVERYRRYHDVTPNGVVFHWELAGPDGASFCLIREAHTTEADLDRAESYLRGARDVVGSIKVATIEPEGNHEIETH